MTKIDLTQHPPFIYPDYRSSRTRGPKKPLLKLCDVIEEEPHYQLGEFQGSLSNKFHIPEGSNNLLINGSQSGAPLGERIVVSGQVLNQWGKPQSGILVDLHPTDYELRLGILQSKVERQKQQYPELSIDGNVLEFLALRISTNVRVLEGALTRLFAFASLIGRHITCLLYTSPSPRDRQKSRMPSSA